MLVMVVLFSPQIKACSTLKQQNLPGTWEPWGAPVRPLGNLSPRRVCEVREGVSIQSGASL